jgi:ABC-2 type transport system ATP-binding protein
MNQNTDGIVIRTVDLTRRFGDFVAVDHVTFTIQRGEVVDYLGPNGSGKTTTIRMLLGLLLPSEGSAKVLGYDVVEQSEQVRERVGYMSQNFSLYQDLTVGETLKFFAGVYGVKDRDRLNNLLDLTGLHDLENQRVSDISVGWRQRLAMGTAIVHQPGLLFLDEPTSEVDPTARRAFWNLIYELVDGGVTALVTTHYMDEAEYCGRVGIMRRGRLLAIDTPYALKQSSLPGLAWDVFAQPLLPALNALETCPGVLRAGLVSDHLRTISSSSVEAADLTAYLDAQGIGQIHVTQVEPTLEDIFLALSTEQ